MKKLFSHLKLVKQAFSKVHLVDKCLILFMLVLMTQSAYSLFNCDKSTSKSNTIDIIVRTSTAAIFGYFLSANFIRSSASKKGRTSVESQINNQLDIKTSSNNPKGSIGFSDNTIKLSENTQLGKVSANLQDEKFYTSSNLQIVVATVIGLFCLITLILLKNTSDWNPDIVANSSVTATVAQFRDFVSGCVGFLIGCPTNEGSNGDSD